MYPKLFEFNGLEFAGPITVYTYGVLLAAAYLLGLKFATIRAKARNLDSVRVLDLGIYIIISALVGAKLLLLITDFRTFRANPAELLTLARSGGVFYGGLILAVAVALWYIRRAGLPLWTTCDVFAPGIALGHVVGRFGCFFAGWCFGKPTTKPWGIVFTDPFAAANVGTPLGVHLHPPQLYEAGAALLILYVDHPVTYALPAAYALTTREQLEEIQARYERDVAGARHAALTAGALRVNTLVQRGDAVTEIIRCATEDAYDLIVMGTHGRSGIARAVLGSVAEQVVRRAPCPVLTIRGDDTEHVEKS